MSSVNKVILIGNVGKDPEVRYNPSGGAWVTVSLATTRSWKNRETGERQEETEWHRVVFNDRLAEVVGEYVKKGRPIYVEGRLKTRKWKDKEDRDTYTTEIICDHMQLLGSRDDAGGSGRRPDPDSQGGGSQQRGQGQGREQGQGSNSYAQQRGQSQQRQGGYGGGQGGTQGGGNRQPAGHGFDDMDDDIPF